MSIIPDDQKLYGRDATGAEGIVSSVAKITREIALDGVVVHPGEHILVWLRTEGKNSKWPDYQSDVELRVQLDGTPEVWLRGVDIAAGIVHSLDNYEVAQPPPAPKMPGGIAEKSAEGNTERPGWAAKCQRLLENLAESLNGRRHADKE